MPRLKGRPMATLRERAELHHASARECVLALRRQPLQDGMTPTESRLWRGTIAHHTAAIRLGEENIRQGG